MRSSQPPHCAICTTSLHGQVSADSAAPCLAAAINDNGVKLRRAGKLKEAERAFRLALRCHSVHPAARSNLANVLYQQGKVNESIIHFTATLALKPSPEIRHQFGMALLSAGRFEEAISQLKRAAEQRAPWPQAMVNLSVAYRQAGAPLLAEQWAINAIEADGTLPEAWCALGAAMMDRTEYRSAVNAYMKALGGRNDIVEAHMQIAISLRELGQIEEAILHARAATKYSPNNAYANTLLATLLLFKGEWSEGWKYYDARFGMPEHFSYIHQCDHVRPWQGEALAGKQIVVYAEQGFGDVIQFIRYLYILSREASKIMFVCHPRLFGLIEQMSPSIPNLVLIRESRLNVNGDYRVALMSIPRYRAIPLASEISVPIHYLRAKPELATRWRTKLSARRPLIGINWSGNSTRIVDRGRSPGLRHFLPILALEGFSFVSLKSDVKAGELTELPSVYRDKIIFEPIDQGDVGFLDTSAIVSLVDLVITSDAAIAHLAGAQGAPTWVALKNVPEWRWGASGSSTPLYQSLTLFRQTDAGEWATVFRRMADELYSGVCLC